MASTNNDSVLLKNTRQRKARRFVFFMMIFIAVFISLIIAGKTAHKFKKYADKNDLRFEQLRDQLHDLNSFFSQRLSYAEKSIINLNHSPRDLEKSLRRLEENFNAFKAKVDTKAYEDTKSRHEKDVVQNQLRNYERKISWLEDQLVNLGAVVSLLEMQSHGKKDNTPEAGPQILKELTELKTKLAKNEKLIDQVSVQQLVQETIVENLAKSVSEIHYAHQREAKDLEKLHESVDQKLSNVEVDLSILKASAMDAIPHEFDSLEDEIMNALKGHVFNAAAQEDKVDESEAKAHKKVEEKHGKGEKKHKEVEDKKRHGKHHDTVKDKKANASKQSFPDKMKNWADGVYNKAKGNLNNAGAFINQKTQKGVQDIKRVAENFNAEVKKFFKKLF